MNWVNRLRRRFLILVRKDKVEEEMDREMRFHLEAETRENVRLGMTAEEARRAALVSFGGVERFKEQSRDERGGRLLDDLAQDVRYTLRSLRKRPRFAFLAVSTLALGIGATTAIFSAVNAVLLQPLPFRQPDRLMRVSLLMPESRGLSSNGTRLEMIWSYPKYRLFRESQDILEGTSTYFRRQYTLTNVDWPERLEGEVVGASYFSVLGVDAELGRTFVPDDDETPAAVPEVVVSHGLWVRRFAADPDIVGATIHLNGIPHTLVGVVPPSFGGLRGAPELWVANSTVDARILESQAHQFHVVGRLEAGVTYEQAVSAMRMLGDQVDEVFPDPRGSGAWSATARPLEEYRVGRNLRLSLLLLFAGAGLVLLTACVNVAGLILAVWETRQREIGTRLALGSSRGRLVRQLMTESLVVSAAGGCLGVSIALSGVRYFNSIGAATRFEMSGLERTAFNSIRIDSTTLVFCLVVVCLAPLLVGLWPAISSSRLPLVNAMKGGGTAGKRRRGLAGGALVITQATLAFTLLAGSGLLVMTVRRLHATELGFRPEGMLTVRIAPPGDQYDRGARQRFFSQLQERVEGLPGILAASFMDCAPLADGCRNTTSMQARDGLSVDPNTEPIMGVTFVSPGFFQTLGISVSQGRVFTPLDRDGAPRVVVISEAAARRFWPGEDAVGRSLSVRGFEEATVIGVVGDVRYDNVEDTPRPNLYVSSLQVPRREGFLIARVSGEASSHIAAIRQTVRDLDADLPIFDVRMMRDRVDDAIWRTRFSTLVTSLFAAMTFILSAIGIYGVFSHSVERATHDIGVRIALGATTTHVLTGILGKALLLAVAGIAGGILLASALTRFMGALLYETSPHDPLVFGAISAVFLAIAVSASYFPARKASGVDPATVLRTE
jgi:predicted permease